MIVLIGVKICNHPLKICTAHLPSRDNIFRIFLKMCTPHEDFMRVKRNIFLISLKFCTPREDFTGGKTVPPVASSVVHHYDERSLEGASHVFGFLLQPQFQKI